MSFFTDYVHFVSSYFVCACILTPEELREPAKRIENKILELAGRKQKVDEVNSGMVDIASLSKEEKLALVEP